MESKKELKKELTDDEIKNACSLALSDTELFSETISAERQEAMERYMMRPLGNEIDGRSQVHASDVQDTVEWCLPQLIEMFQGEEIVSFEPESEADIEQAQQETDYVSYVLDRQNKGFLIKYTWMKDALLSKNGIIKVFWEECSEEEEETYENLSDEEYLQIVSDEDVEVLEHEAFISGKQIGEDSNQLEEIRAVNQLLKATMPGAQVPDLITHSCKVIRNKDVSQVKILNIAPENFRVERNFSSLDLSECRFCAHIEEKTVGELMAIGIKQDLLDQVPTSEFFESDSERQERYRDEGGLSLKDQFSTDDASRVIWVAECFIRIDADGDGKIELWKVLIGGGANGTLLHKEKIDRNPFIAITPIIMTHKFYGRSVADLTIELQKIRTALWRQSLDNKYIANNPRPVVLKNAVNFDDLLDSRIGAPIRVDRVDAVRFDAVPYVADNSSLFAILDDMGERRTGVSKQTQGLDPSAIKDSTNLVGMQLLSAAQLRIKMMARIFAEVGFSPLFLKIHELVRKFEKNSKIAELSGKYVTVDPRGWRKRRNLMINVGLGAGDKQVKLLALQQIMTLQEKALAAQGGTVDGPLVNVDNIYAAVQDFVRLSGLKSKQYFMNPATYEEPEPKPEPLTSADVALKIGLEDIEQRKQAKDQELAQKNKEHEDRMVLEREKMANESVMYEKKLKQEEKFKNRDSRNGRK